MPRILIIDDNPATITALEVLFNRHGLETVGAETPEEGLAILDQGGVDLVVQDMNFSADTTSGDEGTELYCEIREAHPDLPIILLTAWTDVDTAVMLVRSGAADYVGKPWDDDRLLTTVRNLLDLHDLKRYKRSSESRQQRTRIKLAEDFDLAGLVFESAEMVEVVNLATRVARSDVPVLLTGPSGAGKGKLAEIIQRNSARSDRPFVQVNAGALPAELIEAELFGAEAGAYTGAGQARAGRFETADGGTLFLDEIGNLPPEGQMKLLRVLESGEFERLGSSKTRKVDVRVISATNADLRTDIEEGRFREDLFYRLNVIEIEVPPLSRRRDDILPLARHLIGEGHELSEQAASALEQYDWPGNVRELANVIERARLMADGPVILPQHLGLKARAKASATADDDDPDTIAAALEAADGNVSQAARSLGLSRQALYRRMEKLGIGGEEA
jgi:DNA-binding NtrC family response regulator